MSYRVSILIKELKLEIPKSIIGFEYPELKLQDDECSANANHAKINAEKVAWNLKETYVVDYSGWFGELEQLCVKYQGTLIADCNGEETGDMAYIRIRDGQRKTVKVVEE